MDFAALTQRQLENEETVIDQGIKKYRDALRKSEDRGRAADTMPGRWLTAYMIEPIAVKIRGHISEYNDTGRPGPCAIGVTLLNALGADVCAFIALRTIMNSVLNSKGLIEQHVVRGRIVRELVEEIQFGVMEIENSQAYKYWTKEIDRAPDPYTKRRCAARLKGNFEKLPGYATEKEKAEVDAAADALINFTVEATSIVTVERQVVRKGGKAKTIPFLILNPDFRERFKIMSGKAETLLICPPGMSPVVLIVWACFLEVIDGQEAFYGGADYWEAS